MVKNTRKSSGSLKKLSALLLSFAMLLTLAVSVSAEEETNALKNYTTDVTTLFHVQRYGAQMDTNGEITSRHSTYFTSLLYTSTLTAGTRSTSYTLVYPEDDVTAEVTDMPTDGYILSYIRTLYEADGGLVYTASGNIIDWEDFTSDDYYIRWYVLKYDSSDGWHIDGVIMEKSTDDPVEIVDPEDFGSVTEYASNYAYIYGYDDNTMGAEGDLLRCEVSQMLYRLVKQNNGLGSFVYDETADPAFNDIEGEWFRSGIEFMNYKGAFADGDNVYPYVSVTRGEAFKIICLGLGFTDQTDLTYADYAIILYEDGYIVGDQNGSLNIGDLITRAEFCTIYNRIIGREDALLEMSDGTAITADTYGFTDLDGTEWYYEIMLRATSSYDDDGYVDLDLRNQRGILDDYNY